MKERELDPIDRSKVINGCLIGFCLALGASLFFGGCSTTPPAKYVPGEGFTPHGRTGYKTTVESALPMCAR